MNHTPSIVIDYLRSTGSTEKNPIFFNVNQDDKLIYWGGPIDDLSLGVLSKNQSALDQLPFLEGLLPCSSKPEVVPFVQLTPGRYVDLHLVLLSQEQWIIFVNVTLIGRQTQVDQQSLLSTALDSESATQTQNK